VLGGLVSLENTTSVAGGSPPSMPQEGHFCPCSPAAAKRQSESPRGSGKGSTESETETELLMGMTVPRLARKYTGRRTLFSRTLRAATSGGGSDVPVGE
jgi:hypothetical protein